MLVALSGVITGVAAAGHVGPFAALGAAAQHTVATQLPSVPLRADSLYPAPTPPPTVHETIVVTDPAPSRAPSLAGTSTPGAAETPAPSASPSPTSQPCHDEDCGGGGGGGDN
jgi:hypothetical protein